MLKTEKTIFSNFWAKKQGRGGRASCPVAAHCLVVMELMKGESI